MFTNILTYLFNNPLVSYCTLIILVVVALSIDINNYNRSTYYKITHNPYYKVRGSVFSIFKDYLGALGEYLLYNELKIFEKNGAKILFNCYITKSNDQTSEIDVIMIHPSGIYVFENKNYSGWIFGNEKDKFWTQTLPNGKGKTKKSHFLNPIIQNQAHVNTLSNYINKILPVYSIIVFSNRCTLKNINKDYNHSYVIHRSSLQKTIFKIISVTQTYISSDEMNQIYEKLYPLTQVSNDIKKKHIENISSYAKKQ